jgi:sec-independent protein translocase protein TatB
MFDFDAGKFIIIGIVALVVIGPKELPRVLRQLGQAVAKMRRMAAEFQSQFMEAMREADMADVKAEVDKLAQSAKIDAAFDPVTEIKNEIKGAIDKPAPSATPSAALTSDLAAAEAAPSVSRLAVAPPSEAPARAEEPDEIAPVGGPGNEAREPDPVVEAEMQALAKALKAEIEGPRREVEVAHPTLRRPATLKSDAGVKDNV